jgi:hypothetical protein
MTSWRFVSHLRTILRVACAKASATEHCAGAFPRHPLLLYPWRASSKARARPLVGRSPPGLPGKFLWPSCRSGRLAAKNHSGMAFCLEQVRNGFALTRASIFTGPSDLEAVLGHVGSWARDPLRAFPLVRMGRSPLLSRKGPAGGTSHDRPPDRVRLGLYGTV